MDAEFVPITFEFSFLPCDELTIRPRVGKSQDFVKQVSAFFRSPAPEDPKIAAKIGQRALGVLKLHRFLTSD